MFGNVRKLTGYALHALDGEIGSVEDFYFDDHSWTIRYLVADTGTWLDDRQVLISPRALTGVDAEKKYIAVALTKTQIEGSPSLDTDKPVSRQFEEDYYGYYGWPTYWTGSSTWGPASSIPSGAPRQKGTNSEGKPWDPRLRSAAVVTGYEIQATDGEIGHVDDFIIDDASWSIRYLIADTHNWWPGKKVLIAPEWIRRVSWDDSKVFVDLSRDQVKRSPEYTAQSLPTRDYEMGLHRHYDRQGYWDKAKSAENESALSSP